MMKQDKAGKSPPLVSLITACYNGEQFLPQWADSIVNQTYPAIEILFVDDGSADNSRKAFERERPRIEAKGYIARYIRRTNGGAAAAVNTGLKEVTGEYLTLLDVDDILHPEAISVKAKYLTTHSDVDLVRNNGYTVKSDDLDDRSSLFHDGPAERRKNLFNEFLYMAAFPYAGSYMIRSQALFSILKDRNIYISPYGQNLQLLMPVAYFGKTAYIDKPLMKYIRYPVSHSHGHTYERRLELYNGYENNTIQIIDMLEIPKEEKRGYIDTVRKANYAGRMKLGIRFKKRPLIREQYHLMKQSGQSPSKVIFLLSQLPFGCDALNAIPKIKALIKRRKPRSHS